MKRSARQNMSISIFIAAVLSFTWLGMVGAAQPPASQQKQREFKEKIQPFLNAYCNDCHGAKKQKGKRRFDILSFPIKDNNALAEYQEILDLINLNEMPPEDEKQPGTSAKLAIVSWLTDAIAEAQAQRKSQGGETVLRRLNRREYANTIRDLLGMEMPGFDPTATFPGEVRSHHLDNQGHALVTSGFLLEQYLKSADAIIEKVLPRTLKSPQPKTWHSKGPYRHRNFPGVRAFELAASGIFLERESFETLKNMWHLRDRVKLFQRHKKREQSKQLAADLVKRKARAMATENLSDAAFEALVKRMRGVPSVQRLFENPKSDRLTGAYGYMPNLQNGVPVDGYYEVSLTATTMHRTNPTVHKAIGSDLSIPMVFAIVPGDKRLGDLAKSQVVEPILYKQALTGDNKAHPIKVRLWLNKGTTPRFNWLNGATEVRQDAVRFGARLVREGKFKMPERKPGFEDKLEYFGAQTIRLPHIRLTDIRLTGPILNEDTWPTPAMRLLLGGHTFNPKHNKQNLRRFMTRAFRRDASEEELSDILGFIQSREQKGMTPYEAYKDGLKAILSSPSFIYLEENSEENPDQKKLISQAALATRLSYFLWASSPDEQLLNLARQGKLTDQALLAQTNRMLKDPKSERLISGLLDGWLTLNGLNSVLPDRKKYRNFYIDDLPIAMREETHHFMKYVLDNNRPIQDFIDCNYTFANYALDRHYKLKKNISSMTFQKVKLGDTKRGGGLLSHGSVLTVTANGVETSPVIRGIWLLENLLGTPPPPPPPDIEPLEPDIRGAKTMRERLQRHSTDPTCAECHRKIDPLGFALENFGPVGEWRQHYPKHEGGGKISAHGRMPNNKSFNTFQDFKSILLEDEEKFARALTEKLFSYALGRPVEITDRPEIDAILADLKSQGYGFKYLITRVITSPAFKRS